MPSFRNPPLHRNPSDFDAETVGVVPRNRTSRNGHAAHHPSGRNRHSEKPPLRRLVMRVEFRDVLEREFER